MTLVAIDASHGGDDFGDVYGNRMEKEDTLKLALAIGNVLVQNGVCVIQTRITDRTISISNRIRKIGCKKIDLLLSIHRYSYNNHNIQDGVEAIICDKGSFARQAAKNINDNLWKAGYQNHGIIEVEEGLDILGKLQIPSILSMVGFINSDMDNKILDTRFSMTVSGIAAGILDALQISSKSSECKNILHRIHEPVSRYRIQAGLFASYHKAAVCKNTLTGLGYSAHIVPSGGKYAVRTGSISDLDKAAGLEEKVRRAGYWPFLVHRKG